MWVKMKTHHTSAKSEIKIWPKMIKHWPTLLNERM